MSHCHAGVPVEVKIYLSQKIFQLFSKQVFSMFQDFRITLREKNFSDFQTNLGPGIAMRFQSQKLPFTCNQRSRTLPVRIAWKGDWSSCVSLRCGSASRGKNLSKSKNFSTFFKTGFLHVSGLWDYFKGKKFFRLSDQSGSRYRNAIPKPETPLYM